MSAETVPDACLWYDNPDQKIRYDQKNRKLAESHAFKKYEAYKCASTVQEARSLGATTRDLKFDHARQFLSVLQPDEVEEGKPEHHDSHEEHEGEAAVGSDDDEIMEPEPGSEIVEPGPSGHLPVAADIVIPDNEFPDDWQQMRELTLWQWSVEERLRRELKTERRLTSALRCHILKIKFKLYRAKIERAILAGYVRHGRIWTWREKARS